MGTGGKNVGTDKINILTFFREVWKMLVLCILMLYFWGKFIL